jgi:hypothetical protein
MRRLEPLLHVLLLLAVLLACGKPEATKTGPAVSVSAVDLTREYSTMGGEKADAKWAGKDIKVTGIAYITMACQESPSDDVHCIMLQGYDRGGSQALLWVQAWLAPQAPKQIQPPATVTLQCHVPEEFAVQGDWLSVSVQDCTILSVGAASAPAPRTPPPTTVRRPVPRKAAPPRRR